MISGTPIVYPTRLGLAQKPPWAAAAAECPRIPNTNHENTVKSRNHPFLSLVLTLAVTTTLPAATLYWDGADTTANADGGAGTWNTDALNPNWDDAATAGVDTVWPSAGTDNAVVFGTPAGLVTIDPAGVNANDIAFGLTGYTVGGGLLTLNGTTNILTSTAAVSNTTVTNLTISSGLAGTNGFTKAGVGNLVLSGDNTGLSGIVTINNATGTNNSGLNLSGADAPGGITQFDVGGTAAADGSFLGLANTTLGSGVTLNLSGQGGYSAPIGTLRATAGVVTANGPMNLLTANIRISNYGATSLTLNGAVTTTPSTNGLMFRHAQNQGIILTNTANNWGGTTILGEGSLYCYPGALPATTNLQIGGSNPADYGTNGSFTRALGAAAGQVQFGKGNDGQRAMGFSARGGALTVNLGGAGGDLVLLNTFAKAGAITSGSATVTVTDATNLLAGMSITGTGIPADTLVSNVVGTTVTLSKNATATNAAAALTFYAAATTARLNASILVLNGANADSALTFQNPVDLNGFNRVIQVSANTATLTGGIKNSSATAAGLRKTGAGTLAHDPGAAHTLSVQSLQTSAGTLEVKSGTITVSAGGGTGYAVGQNGFTVVGGATFRLNGGTVNAKTASYVFTAGHTTGGTGNFILDSGTFDAGTVEVLNAYGANGTTTINGGLFICGEFRVCQSAPGTVNLNGGTLRATRLKHSNNSEIVNFNGGTLQAKSSVADLITTSVDTVNILAGGAVIDSNGFNVTIPKLLTEDGGSTGGGLTKKGNGILDLTADNTYTGTNLIQGGVLRVSATPQLGTAAAPVTVNGGEFGVSGIGIASLSSLGRTFTYTTGGFHVADAAHTLDVDIALTGSAALSKSGPGVITLSGANDFTGGITMGSGDNGWIEVDSATDLGTGVKIANMAWSAGSSIGGIRLLNNVTVSDVALDLAGRNVNAATQHALLNVSGNNVWAGNINISNSGGTYYLRSDSGRLELSGILSNAQAATTSADIRAFNLEGPGDFLISGAIMDGSNTNRFAALVMEGTGTTTLTGINTYTGSTAVKAGTLALVGGSQQSPITVDSGATLGFALGAPTTSTSTVTFSGATAKVKVTGTPVAATLMTSTNITGTPVLDPAIPGFELAIEGGGTLLNLKEASTGSFTTWATTTNGLSGGDAAATADPDSDGLDNAIEFVIGGQPNPANPNANSSRLAPTVSTDASNLIFTFRSTDLAQAEPGISIQAEYGSTLSGWKLAVHGTDGVTVVTTQDGYGAGIDKVEVTIPKSLATGPAMFARLNVVIP